MEPYTRVSDGDATDYDKLKKALLNRYNFTEDGYRRSSEVSEVKPETEETLLKNYLHIAKWLQLFINACSEELAVYLIEGEPKELVELTTCPQQYLIAQKQQLGARPSQQSSLNLSNKENQHSLN